MIKSYKVANTIANTLIHIFLAVLSVVWLFPIAWLVLISFNTEKGIPNYIWPKGFTLDNYKNLLADKDLFPYTRWFGNTFLVAILSCILATLFVLMVAYAFSRLRFKSRRGYLNISLILNMFPGFMSMIAIYHIFKTIGMSQSLMSLVLVYSGGASLGYMIAKGFFDTIPKALDEAATIDGATRNQIFWRITLPLSKPIVVYTALTSFIAPWIDFIFVSVIMKDNYQNYTIALGLFKMISRENMYKYFTQFCAGAVLIAIPITILFVIMQKFYVDGVTGGATKG